MRLLSMLIGVSGAGQHSLRLAATSRRAIYNTNYFTFNGTDADATGTGTGTGTASDVKNNISKSTPDQQDGRSGKGGTITGITQKAFLPLNANFWGERTTLWILIMIGGTIIFCCLGGFLCSILNRQRRRDGQRRQFKQVFGYLNKMDIDDLDIRRSPAGGFHISYLNDLAAGGNAPTVASDDEETTSEVDINVTQQVEDENMATIIGRIEEWRERKGRKTKIGPPTMFLRNLRDFLDTAESLGFDHMVCWSPDGESFRIFEARNIDPIINAFFQEKDWKSFLRELRLFGFQRFRRGNDFYTFRHPQFRRGRGDLSERTMTKRRP